jgi:hypothetical protein
MRLSPGLGQAMVVVLQRSLPPAPALAAGLGSAAGSQRGVVEGLPQQIAEDGPLEALAFRVLRPPLAIIWL